MDKDLVWKIERERNVALNLDLVHSIAHSKTRADLRSVAERFCVAHHFSHWVYALAGPDRALTNFPTPLVSDYLENRWWHSGSDLLIDAIHKRHRVLSWSLDTLTKSDRPLDKVQRHILDSRYDLGIRAGISAPAYARCGSALDYAIVSFSRDRPFSATERRHHEPHVQLFADYFLSVAPAIFLEESRIGCSQPVSLTSRERECLTWVAVGKSSWEIGQILDVSPATVNFHLGNASSKLGAHGRIRAVAQAIRLGLINPS